MSRLFAAAVAFAVAGCSHGGGAPPPSRGPSRQPEVVLSPDGGEPVHVKVELARSPAEQQRGLMYRDHLDDGRGMLFLFAHPHHLTFWMRNTYVPLDMIFLTADRKVLGVVEKAQPLTDDPREVDGISQFVLEVPGGWASAHRIGPGTAARFVDVD